MTVSPSLPTGPWQPLFARAVLLLDDLRNATAMPHPFRTLGGGTVLMFRYDHRASKDIDIFVPDPQYLGYLSPRLSDTAADMTSDYVEEPSSYVKLQFDEGEIDFVASPNLLDDAWEWWSIAGKDVRVEHPAEIIAKKMYHRGQQATPRDLFDLCLVIERAPEALRASRPLPAPASRCIPEAHPRPSPYPGSRIRCDRPPYLHANPRPLHRSGLAISQVTLDPDIHTTVRDCTPLPGQTAAAHCLRALRLSRHGSPGRTFLRRSWNQAPG